MGAGMWVYPLQLSVMEGRLKVRLDALWLGKEMRSRNEMPCVCLRIGGCRKLYPLIQSSLVKRDLKLTFVM